jgi:hypothetical protein
VSTSMILLLVGLGCGAGFAALAVYGQVRGGGRLREVSWGVPIGILVFGALFGAGAYWLDSGVAGTTLFEVDAPGSAGVTVGAPAPVLEYDVAVEHPGVEHSLLVDPRIDGADAEAPIELHVRLTDGGGQVLLDEPLRHEVECSSRSVWCGWESWTGRFTPRSADVHRLTVTVLTVDVPVVHLRVEDPEKTDGERAPGY